MKKYKKGNIFAAVGAATGLGNAFRFPSLCVTYGAAFIVAYAVVLALVCYPLLVAEFSFGRRKLSGKAAKIWATVMRAAAVNSALIALYYGVIAAKLGSASVSFALFGGADNGNFLPLILAAPAVAAAVFIVLRRAPRSLAVSGKISVTLSLALFGFLAVAGILHGNAFSTFNPAVLCDIEVWADALGQAALALSLAAGIMPDFARAQTQPFYPRRAALKIVAANFFGCVLATLSTLPFITRFPATVGISCALTVYPQVILGIFGGGVSARVFGTFTFAVLTVVAVHSLCSLAAPALNKVSARIKRTPLIFTALCVLSAPLFMCNNLEVLSSCDRLACSVSAVLIAFSECLFFASQGHIKGVIGFMLRFLCPVTCGVTVLFSLCSARFDCFSPLAAACAALYFAVVAAAAVLPRLSKLRFTFDKLFLRY